MSTKSLAKVREMLPSVFDDFFKPWNDRFDGNGFLQRTLTVPAVNIKDEDDHYEVTLAAPGMTKKDFAVDIDGDILTISAEKEEEKEENKKKFSRREYSYSSFSRSFSLPDEVLKDKIEATYTDGVLTINLPKNENSTKTSSKKVQVN